MTRLPASMSALQRRYGARWQIWFNPRYLVWYAERRDGGTSMRLLAAYAATDLATKIERAEGTGS